MYNRTSKYRETHNGEPQPHQDLENHTTKWELNLLLVYSHVRQMQHAQSLCQVHKFYQYNDLLVKLVHKC